MKNQVVEIELPFWKNPQCHVFTESFRDTLKLYFSCWDKNADLETSYMGCINFKLPIFCQILSKTKTFFVDEPLYSSSIYMVKNSSKLKKYLDKANKWSCNEHYDLASFKHYVLDSHEGQILIYAKDLLIIKEYIHKKNEHIYKRLVDSV